MRKEGLSLNVTSVSAAISAWEKRGQWQFVALRVSETHKEGLSLNVTSVSADISAWEKGGQGQFVALRVSELRKQDFYFP
eukprot:11008253-Karenia_brevis.AAC.1